MSPYTNPPHVFTTFELDTILAFVVQGAHLYDEGTHATVAAENAARRAAHRNFASKVNVALHGTDYSKDIREREIIACLKKMMVERKHVIGDLGLVERSTARHLTRRIKMAWNSNRKGDFNGNRSEWENGRREKVMDELRKEKGLPTVQEERELKKKAAAAEAEKVRQAARDAERAFQRKNRPQTFTSRLDQYHDPAFQVDLPAKRGTTSFTRGNDYLVKDGLSSYDAAFGHSHVRAPTPGAAVDEDELAPLNKGVGVSNGGGAVHGNGGPGSGNGLTDNPIRSTKGLDENYDGDELEVEYDPAKIMRHFSASRSPEPAVAVEMKEGKI